MELIFKSALVAALGLAFSACQTAEPSTPEAATSPGGQALAGKVFYSPSIDCSSAWALAGVSWLSASTPEPCGLKLEFSAAARGDGVVAIILEDSDEITLQGNFKSAASGGTQYFLEFPYWGRNDQRREPVTYDGAGRALHLSIGDLSQLAGSEPPADSKPYTLLKGGKSVGDLAGSKFARGKTTCTFARVDVRCVNAHGLNFTGKYSVAKGHVTLRLSHHRVQNFEFKGKELVPVR